MLRNMYIAVVLAILSFFVFRSSVLGAVLVGLHITHGFWSAFQTIGFSNDIWRKRLECLAYFFAIVFAVGFSIIPLYFIAGLGN